MKRALAAFWLLLLLLSNASWAQAPIRFGVLSFRPDAQSVAQWQPLATYLESALKRPVQLSMHDLAGLEGAVARGALDVVFTNPGHYILLNQRYALSAPLATQVNAVGDEDVSVFGGVIFVRADASKIDSLEDVPGRRVALSSTDFLGGYQLQAFAMQGKGLPLPQPEMLLVTGMPQDVAVNAVLAGHAEVGFVRTGILESMVTEGRLDPTAFKIIHRQDHGHFPYASSTPLVPEWPVAVMSTVEPKLARSLAIALLELPRSSPTAIAAGLSGFMPAANYGGVETLLRSLRAAPFEASRDRVISEVWMEFKGWIVALIVLVGLLVCAGLILFAQNLRLLHAKQRARAIIHSAMDAVVQMNAQGLITGWNPQAEQLFGWSHAEAMGRAMHDTIIPAHSREAHQMGVKRHLSTDTSTILGTVVEVQAMHRDGHLFPVELVITALKMDGSREFNAFIRDISNRKLLEGTLHFLADHSGANDREGFFPALAAYLANALDADYVCVDRLSGDGLTADSVAVFQDGGLKDNVRYALDETPCGDVVKHGVCAITRGVCERFPNDGALQDLQAQGYIGVTLWGGGKKPIGLIAVISRKPLQRTSLAEAVLNMVAVRAAGELERDHAQARLQLAGSVFTHAREGILITDAQGIIVDVNETFCAMTGYSRAEALGQNPRFLQSGRQGAPFYAAMWKDLAEKGFWSGEIWNRRKDGEVFAELENISAVRDANGAIQNYVGLFTDITQIKEHQLQLEHIAHFDVLTGLPNRVLLADRLQQAMAHCQRLGHTLVLAYFDLDGFKAVNDAYGHAAGDELLIAVANNVKSALRDGDTLARIGGDEFVALLVDLDPLPAFQPVLARLLESAATPVQVANTVLHVSASIGVTIYPQDGVDADQLMRHADQAMYLAKQAGKNRYHLFDVARDAAVQTQRESLEHIRRGLDRSEFVLYYQPKVNMKTGLAIGAEALIRWQHPERGLLSPAVFLPIIEGHPLSEEVGEWVIATALTQMTDWHALGLALPVSVNIGARQLQQPGFVDRLGVLLAEHPQVPPHCLELEILETSALEDMRHVSDIMRACQAVGVRFALDDFGTGYSSLTYLKHLPAEVIKIDQSFVHDMLSDPDDLAIVKGVIGLAAAFQREVIAEGVETAVHGVQLLALGAELAQGYGIARPMPAHAVREWVARWQQHAAWLA
jgi:diguanylate cyclase (GGDEF)-like protein/PAS domain S-box-containing protein